MRDLLKINRDIFHAPFSTASLEKSAGKTTQTKKQEAEHSRRQDHLRNLQGLLAFFVWI